MLSSAFRGLENMFVQYLQGTIDEESWQALAKEPASNA